MFRTPDILRSKKNKKSHSVKRNKDKDPAATKKRKGTPKQKSKRTMFSVPVVAAAAALLFYVFTNKGGEEGGVWLTNFNNWLQSNAATLDARSILAQVKKTYPLDKDVFYNGDNPNVEKYYDNNFKVLDKEIRADNTTIRATQDHPEYIVISISNNTPSSKSRKFFHLKKEKPYGGTM